MSELRVAKRASHQGNVGRQEASTHPACRGFVLPTGTLRFEDGGETILPAFQGRLGLAKTPTWFWGPGSSWWGHFVRRPLAGPCPCSSSGAEAFGCGLLASARSCWGPEVGHGYEWTWREPGGAVPVSVRGPAPLPAQRCAGPLSLLVPSRCPAVRVGAQCRDRI